MSTASAAREESFDTLESFLVGNPQDNLTEEIFLSDRFEDAGFKFRISAPDGKQFTSYQKEAIQFGKRRQVSFDAGRLNELLVVNHTLEPNFRNTEFLQKLGVRTAEDAVYRVLKPGEIQDLSTAIQALAGFQTEDELLDKAKN